MVLATDNGGRSWVQEALPPSPPRSGAQEETSLAASSPAAISCGDAQDCIVVNGNGTVAATVDGGVVWSAETSPPAVTELRAVDCPRAGDCYAVGEGMAATVFGAVLETNNNGITWRLTKVPTGTDYLEGVSCSAASSCVAVSDGTYPIISTSDGRTWMAPGTPTPVSVQEFGLFGVSCTSTTSCLAVGTDDDGGVVMALSRGGGGVIMATAITNITSTPSSTISPEPGTRATAPTVPVIEPGTKPHDVPLSAACAQAIVPAEELIHSMHSGGILDPDQDRTLNAVLRTAPSVCSAYEYRNWQYQDLLPWMRMPVGTSPT